MLWTSVTVFLASVGLASSGYSWDGVKDWDGGPQFETTAHEIVVRPGQQAILPCRVRHLADKVVSWIRRTDLHIISSGPFIFTRDSRFSVVHPEGDSVAWGLRLRNATLVDTGLYECQVNTDPKIKQTVLLNVIEKPAPIDYSQKDDSNAYGTGWASIEGPAERYVKVGNSVSLRCRFKSPSRPYKPAAHKTGLVDWLHDDQLLTFGSGGGGVRIDTEREGSEVTSTLLLGYLHSSDSGRYTCSPHTVRPASVQLFVVDGEHSEAMQGFSRGSRTLISFLAFIALSHLLYL